MPTNYVFLSFVEPGHSLFVSKKAWLHCLNSTHAQMLTSHMEELGPGTSRLTTSTSILNRKSRPANNSLSLFINL